MNWTRRNFLAAGALTAIAAPLAGCKKKETEMAKSDIVTPAEVLIAAQPGYFESKFGITKEIIDKVLSRAMMRGGTFGDLFFENTRNGAVSMLDGKVTRATSSVTLGMGVRCVNEDQVGYAFTESLTLEDMLKAADAASSIAPGKAPVQISGRLEKDFKRYYSQTVDWDTLDVARAVALLKSIESKTREKDPSIIQVTLAIAWNQRAMMINTSDGINAQDSQPYYTLQMSIVMNRGGEIQSNGDSIAGQDDFDSLTEDRIDALIDRLTADTSILFEAIKPKGGEWPVVLGAGSSGILLHEAIGHGMEADFNRKEQSIFSTKLNQKVSSEEVTICDSGLIENSRGALNVDDEGTPGQDTVLVENGILRSYLHDRISAAHYKISSTGNGRRESYKDCPIPRMRTTYMKNGTHSTEELIKNIKYGLFCKKYTNGQVFIGAGDYTFYVKNGFLIEDGKITAPIKDVNIIGNGPDTLSKITMTANDFALSQTGWTCGKNGQSVPVSLGMPSVLVSSITVGGV